ncbi:hypothetical protein IFM47457_11138 [Aspergillus lentulus]|nr:hypothetical protein IFM47457_11138 [Aspergillus lentulus]
MAPVPSTPKKRGCELLIANLNPMQSHCLSRQGRTGMWAKNLYTDVTQWLMSLLDIAETIPLVQA